VKYSCFPFDLSDYPHLSVICQGGRRCPFVNQWLLFSGLSAVAVQALAAVVEAACDPRRHCDGSIYKQAQKKAGLAAFLSG
jgi:rhodanese-related sulfurtransferase